MSVADAHDRVMFLFRRFAWLKVSPTTRGKILMQCKQARDAQKSREQGTPATINMSGNLAKHLWFRGKGLRVIRKGRALASTILIPFPISKPCNPKKEERRLLRISQETAPQTIPNHPTLRLIFSFGLRNFVRYLFIPPLLRLSLP